MLVFDPDYDDLSRYDEEVNDWDEKNCGRGYFRRHWVGHLPLPVAYWVNGAMLSALVARRGRISRPQGQDGVAFAAGDGGVALGYIIVSSLVWMWSSVGIWRSAYWHRRRGGSAGWGFAARALVLLGALGITLRAGDVGLQAAELGKLARGEDSIGKVAEMKVSPGRAGDRPQRQSRFGRRRPLRCRPLGRPAKPGRSSSPRRAGASSKRSELPRRCASAASTPASTMPACPPAPTSSSPATRAAPRRGRGSASTSPISPVSARASGRRRRWRCTTATSPPG